MNTRALFLLTLAFASPSVAFAAEENIKLENFKNEVVGSSSKFLFFSDTPSAIGEVELGYSHTLGYPFQISADFKFISETDFTRYQIHIGPTFNFCGHSLEDSCFVGAGLGISHFSWDEHLSPWVQSTQPTSFSGIIRAGARVPITTHLSWMPQIQSYSQLTANRNYRYGPGFPQQSFSMIPLSFSVMF